VAPRGRALLRIGWLQRCLAPERRKQSAREQRAQEAALQRADTFRAAPTNNF